MRTIVLAVCGMAASSALFAQPVLTMVEDFETFPAGAVGPPGRFSIPQVEAPQGYMWGENFLQTQPWLALGGVRDLADAPAGGNASRVVFAHTPFSRPGQFSTADDAYTLTWAEAVRPLHEAPARVSVEHFVSNLDEGMTFEIANTLFGLGRFTARWGATWCDDCGGLSFPEPPVRGALYLPFNSATPDGAQTRARWCLDAGGTPIAGCIPTGDDFGVGDPVVLPESAWFIMAYEVRSDGSYALLIDLLDGNGENVAGAGIASFSAFNQVGASSTYSVLGATAYFDNIAVSGAPRISCGADANFDGRINFIDINLMLNNYGSEGIAFVDANGDGITDFADLNAALAGYGSACD